MKKLLIVVDMQKGFVDGALGTKEAAAIVPNVVSKINAHQGDIIVTYDTHFDDYMTTSEGKNLPVPHCIKGTDGWKLDAEVQKALDHRRSIRCSGAGDRADRALHRYLRGIKRAHPQGKLYRNADKRRRRLLRGRYPGYA